MAGRGGGLDGLRAERFIVRSSLGVGARGCTRGFQPQCSLYYYSQCPQVPSSPGLQRAGGLGTLLHALHSMSSRSKLCNDTGPCHCSGCSDRWRCRPLNTAQQRGLLHARPSSRRLAAPLPFRCWPCRDVLLLVTAATRHTTAIWKASWRPRRLLPPAAAHFSRCASWTAMVGGGRRRAVAAGAARASNLLACDER
jgi:hypothetical protein